MAPSSLLPSEDPIEPISQPESNNDNDNDNEVTQFYLTYSVEALNFYFQNQPNIYVSGNEPLYYDREKPSSVITLDVYVVFDVLKQQRANFKVWEEGGKTPAFILDILTETTQMKEQKARAEIYKKLGVREYFQYDFWGDHINPVLQGFHLVNNQYKPIDSFVNSKEDLWIYSEVLGLELRLISGELQFHDLETGQLLLTS